MRIQSNDLPQADRIESVIAATLAIANGAKTDIEIANEVPGIEGDSRQGRYYRRAAEILGLISNRNNNASITEKGQLFSLSPTLTNPILVKSVLNLNLYQKLLPYIELHPEGISRRQIVSYLELIATPDIGETMIPRRISTILAWIKSLGIIEQNGDLFRLSNDFVQTTSLIDIIDIHQPILPTTCSLQEYEMVESRIENAHKEVIIYKNQASVERANYSHIELVNLVAERIKNAGAIPKSNKFIDLAATLDNDYIFEMKSTTELNIKSQVRKGISQLYEYRYLQNKPDANLVLVIENPLTGDNSWLIDYIENDRNIHLVWDGDNNLFSTERTKEHLEFLRIQ